MSPLQAFAYVGSGGLLVLTMLVFIGKPKAINFLMMLNASVLHALAVRWVLS